MPSESSPGTFRRFAAALAGLLALFVAAGCGESASVPLAPLAQGGTSGSELGGGVRALSHGPGYKGSVLFSPDGERVAFTVDGYVVDQKISGEDRRLWTTRDFDAQELEWDSGRRMTILGSPGTANRKDSGQEMASLYSSKYSADAPEVSEVASGVSAAARTDSAGDLLCAFAQAGGARSSSLALISAGQVARMYAGQIEGTITGISVSPDGSEAALAVRLPGKRTSFELWAFNLTDGSSRRLARLPGSFEVFGAPQWTGYGIYYVAGSGAQENDRNAPYKLYRLSPGARPQAAPGVGSDFTASAIRSSPDGSKLAIVGRLRPDSPTNLHLLDLKSGELRSLTTNENMEIKNGPDDLAFSPNGKYVVIIAREAFSTPKVHDAPAGTLTGDFYNLYAVPVSRQKPATLSARGSG